jgi:hypothetical protein
VIAEFEKGVWALGIMPAWHSSSGKKINATGMSQFSEKDVFKGRRPQTDPWKLS